MFCKEIIIWYLNALTMDTPNTMTNATDARPITITATAHGGKKSSFNEDGLGWGSRVLTTIKNKDKLGLRKK